MRKFGSGLTHFYVALHNVDQRAAEGQSDHMILVLVKMVENHFIVPTARQELYDKRPQALCKRAAARRAALSESQTGFHYFQIMESNIVVYPLTVAALAVAVMIGDGCCSFVSISLGTGETIFSL